MIASRRLRRNGVCMQTDELCGILKKFCIEGEPESFKSVDTGHINRTLKCVCRTAAGERMLYTLQAINTYVFKEPLRVMENIQMVTSHLRAKIAAAGGDIKRETLTIIPTVNGELCYIDRDENYWRVYPYIDNAKTYDTVANPIHLFNAGAAFGNFQKLMADFPIKRLHDTIPDFHNTKKRLNAFLETVENDAENRAASVREDIAFFEKRLESASQLINLAEAGKLPKRVTHNDTKYNNILIDDATGKALCVLDLDTVMPGLPVYDYGDAIRFAANAAEEDERDLSKVYLNFELYEQFTRGFIGASTGFLNNTELDYMPLGAITVTIELASRFLADHINGDKYFRIHHPGHNLERARNQMTLALDMERNYDRMCSIAKRYQ